MPEQQKMAAEMRGGGFNTNKICRLSWGNLLKQRDTSTIIKTCRANHLVFQTTDNDNLLSE